MSTNKKHWDEKIEEAVNAYNVVSVTHSVNLNFSFRKWISLYSSYKAAPN